MLATIADSLKEIEPSKNELKTLRDKVFADEYIEDYDLVRRNDRKMIKVWKRIISKKNESINLTLEEIHSIYDTRIIM